MFVRGVGKPKPEQGKLITGLPCLDMHRKPLRTATTSRLSFTLSMKQSGLLRPPFRHGGGNNHMSPSASLRLLRRAFSVSNITSSLGNVLSTYISSTEVSHWIRFDIRRNSMTSCLSKSCHHLSGSQPIF